MNWYKVESGYRLDGAGYDALIRKNRWPAVEIKFDGHELAVLPLVSAVDRADAHEVLTDPVLTVKEQGSIELEAKSSLWEKHVFLWKFENDHIHMKQYVEGTGALGRCYFCSSGASESFARGDSAGFDTNVQMLADGYFSPAINLANRMEFDTGEPGTIGLTEGDMIYEKKVMPVMSNDLFVPPLSYVFHKDHACMGIGIGVRPGSYRFNEFVYTGVMYAGGAFYVDYLGYTKAEEHELPELILRFGYDPYSVLQDYVHDVDRCGYGTGFTGVPAPWHRQPIFCGWSAQTAAASLERLHARDFCTQANYEKWLDMLDQRGIEYGTVVIDDKWQKGYGNFEVDTEKWPDLKGFVKHQHEKGKHVLLWAPVLFTDGLPEEECIIDSAGKRRIADLANEAYRNRFVSRIRELVAEYDVDGFKEDLINCGMTEKNLAHYGKYHGIEMLAAFQQLLHDTVHAIKADALIETQTPNPVMRCSSDMLRLNDLWYGAHNLPEIMRNRARIARIAGWRTIDCDDGGASGIQEWRAYVNMQPDIGVPSLYFVTETEATHEKPSEEDWHILALKWHDYRRTHDPVD